MVLIYGAKGGRHWVATVAAMMKETGIRRMFDLGGGDGVSIRCQLKECRRKEMISLDVAHRQFEIATDRLRTDDRRPHRKGCARLLY